MKSTALNTNLEAVLVSCRSGEAGLCSDSYCPCGTGHQAVPLLQGLQAREVLQVPRVLRVLLDPRDLLGPRDLPDRGPDEAHLGHLGLLDRLDSHLCHDRNRF